MPLTNFTARILADLASDDGAEVARAYRVEATLGDATSRFEVAADRFDAMDWAPAHLGASAIVYPGLAARDHARVAIRLLSNEIPEERVYAHLGWRDIDGSRSIFMPAARSAPQVAVPGIVVDVPRAGGFRPPDPAGDADPAVGRSGPAWACST